MADATAVARAGRLAGLPGGRGWVLIGSTYSSGSEPGSLDDYMKRFLKRATAGWLAVVLEKAAVITIDRLRPAKIKLRECW
jgi:hypothetical protein